jgi:hypothetical protein
VVSGTPAYEIAGIGRARPKPRIEKLPEMPKLPKIAEIENQNLTWMMRTRLINTGNLAIISLKEGGRLMDAHQLNRISGRVLMALSLVALVTVLTGYAQAPQQDEGSAAHIFQLAIVAVVPTMLLFFFSADWRQRWRSARPLTISAAALVVAFGALYYLEHYWWG